MVNVFEDLAVICWVDSVGTEVGVNYRFETRSQYLFWWLSFVERNEGWLGRRAR